MANFLDEHGLSVVWERIKELIDKKILRGLTDKLDKQDSKGIGYIAYNPSSNNIGNYASVLGYHCNSTSTYAHSEGYECTASASAAHAEGCTSRATAQYAHAEGYYGEASKTAAHVEGYHTTADSNYQHVQGKYNVIDSSSTYADIVGWGTSTSSSGRKNIEATTVTGDKRLKGDVYVHCNDDSTGGESALSYSSLVVETYADHSSKSVGTSGANTSYNISKAGYFPIGVVGFYISSANVLCRACYLTNVQAGSATINYYMRSVSGTNTATQTTRVLWAKI